MAIQTGPRFYDDVGLAEFQEGLERLRDGDWTQAAAHLRKALGREPHNPFYISYAGLVAALAEDRIADAELLCQDAIQQKPEEPQFYLNLADVYQRAGRRIEAIKILESGLSSTGRHSRILWALERKRFRRSPVLPFLGRNNPLNRTLGRLRHQILGPLSTG